MSLPEYSKVVGTTKTNEDGQSRQEIISELVFIGDKLILRREPRNLYDANAIQVLVPVGSDAYQIGYLSSELAKKLAPLMDSGRQIDAYVEDVTGDEGQNSGVNIRFYYDGTAPPKPAPVARSEQPQKTIYNQHAPAAVPAPAKSQKPPPAPRRKTIHIVFFILSLLFGLTSLVGLIQLFNPKETSSSFGALLFTISLALIFFLLSRPKTKSK